MLKIKFINYSTGKEIEKEYNFPVKPTQKTYDRFEKIEDKMIESNVEEFEDYGISYILKGKEYYSLDDFIDLD